MKTNTSGRWCRCAVIIGALIVAAPATADIVNVPGDATTIQGGIDLADPGDTVIVAPGTYNESLTIDKVVTVRSSAPTDPFVVADTIIDGLGFFHAVTFGAGSTTGTQLNGFTIRNGSAIGASAPDDRGGGVYVNGVSPRIRNCVIRFCSAKFGGGIFIEPGSSPLVDLCTFDQNVGISSGAGIDNRGTDVVVRDCVFTVNTATLGGGIYHLNAPDAEVTRCIFDANVANTGGGMYIHLSSVNVSECLFAGNRGNSQGGGVRVSNAASFVNCVFSGNESDDGGGILTVASSDTPTQVINCTFRANDALSASGGGIYNAGYVNVANSILWENTAALGPQIYNLGVADVDYSDVEGGGFPGTGNLDADPLFWDADGPDDVVGTVDDNLRPRPVSPVIDVGSNGLVPGGTTTDLDGLDRITDGDGDMTATVDMGAYEFSSTSSPFVTNITQNETFATFAHAMTGVHDLDLLQAAPLSFELEPDIDVLGRAVTIRSTGEIVQPLGGLYVFADDAALSTAVDTDLELNGELRVKSSDAVDILAQQLVVHAYGELVARTDASLFVTTDVDATINGEVSLLPGATMSFSGAVSGSGDLVLLDGSTFIADGDLETSGTLTALDADLTAGTWTNTGTATATGIAFVADAITTGGAGVFIGRGELFAPVTNEGAMTYIGDTTAVGDYTNEGTTTVQIGTLTIIGTLTNNGTIIGDVASTAGGTQPGDGLSIAGDYVAGADASLLMPDAAWRLTVNGDYDVAIDDHANYDMVQAELRLVGGVGARSCELMSIDSGHGPSGLDRTYPRHYPIGTVRIAGGAVIDLVDAHDNDGRGQATCETLYADTLILETGATLNTNGCRVYYGTGQLDGAIDVPANVIPIDFMALCPSDTDGTGVVDIDDIVNVVLDWGTDGSAHRGDVDGSGLVDIDDIVKTVVDWGGCP